MDRWFRPLTFLLSEEFEFTLANITESSPISLLANIPKLTRALSRLDFVLILRKVQAVS
jgi:hypothetical protein